MHGSREAGSQRRADSREEIGYLVMRRAFSTILGHRITLMSIQHRAPNKRLKLSAPVANAAGGHTQLRCASIPFENTSSRRRSLSAIR